jgi:hypothetical protein
MMIIMGVVGTIFAIVVIGKNYCCPFACHLSVAFDNYIYLKYKFLLLLISLFRMDRIESQSGYTRPSS